VNGGFGGITETGSYNNRLQRTSVQASSSAGTALNLAFCSGTFSFSTGCSSPSTNNNVSITGLTNNTDNGRSESVAYDPLNRIQSAASQATSGTDCWGQSFTIDGWGNLTGMTQTQCSPGLLSVGVNGNNQLVSAGFAYDAAGNMTNDGTVGYTYDAENRLTSAAGVTYSYDGNGLRVKKSNGTLYWRATTGDAIAETDLSGNTQSEYVFSLGRRIARIDSSTNVYYYFSDQLGTTRTITTSTGALCYDADFTPYGGEMSHANSCSQNYKFTGYERDSETGLDYAFARFYNYRLGRFMSADPLGGDPDNPQTLNRYAYVVNNTPNAIDPSGRLGVKVPSAPDDFFGGNCSLNGMAIACSVLGGLIGAGGAAACPNNVCSGFGVDANGNTVFAQFYAFAGGTSGYYNPSDIAQGVWEWNGQLLTAQGYYDYVIKPYEDKMAEKVAAALGIPASNVTASGVKGGNANFQIDENTWAEKSTADGCSSDVGTGIRCGFAPSLHFESGLDPSGNMIYWIHMDTANPSTGLLGLVIHGFVDGFLGNTVLSSGVPH
jgi:RHS repeat-associated protein